MRKRWVTVALAGLLTAIVPSLNASAATGIGWQECGTEFKGQCASIPVPIDWADPGGAKFDLAIGRLPALDPAHRIGVLVVHPGGPGSSGLERYITGRGIPDDSPLRQRFDIVSLDPRGVGKSHPVMCSKEIVYQTPLTFPASEAEYQALKDFNARLAKDCRAHTGPLFDHVDTTSAARDVDAVRAALGERRISFFAISYGTQVGQQYAELFPNRIRAMAIDSNMDHSITSAFEYMRTTTEDLEGSFLTFAGWCDRTPACGLHGQDVVALWDDLHARAEKGTLTDPSTGQPVGAESLRQEMFGDMYAPEDWFALADRLNALKGAGLTATAAEETTDNSYPAIWCSDWSWQVDGFAELDRYRRTLARIYPHTRISPFWSDVTSCLGWPFPASNPQHRLDVHGAPTILVVKGKYDVATPRDWNFAVSQQIRNSVLLQYDGVGHGQFRNSKCAKGKIESYLIDRGLPAPGTHCAPEFPTQPTISARTMDRAR
ncbi:alpha/beta hydrolase [Actinocrispum sp. NPDC049592]|uniref:alpha/beta hydrolase n=1 Tax=Actinocrispum sp. NPDC049592 TaxID=3154835 RepID=UPI003418EDEB